MTILSNIQNTVLSKISDHRNIIVAYSGGIDSSVLLHALVTLRNQYLPDLQIQAIYIHHGISQNADNWAEHCRWQCQMWQVPYFIETVKLDLTQGNIEEQARIARYQAISKHLIDDIALCTAQHLDDQSETFLLALKRGSGPTGLSSMPDISKLSGHLLIRPLLSVSRLQIEQYAEACKLTWIEDESNQDDHYDRNFLRLNVLPLLNQRWPHFNQMVARSAELCHEQQQLLDDLLLDSFKQLLDSESHLLITPLYDFSESKRNAILRMWFKYHHINMPSRKQLDMIWQNVALAKEDSNPQFLLHHKQIRRYQNRLYLLPQYQDLQSTIVNWDFSQSLCLPDNLGELSVIHCQNGGCRLPMDNEKVTVRFNAQGIHQVIGRNGRRQIKKLWQEFGIPPWMRTRIPLVFYNDILITAVNVFTTEQGYGNKINYVIR